MVYDFLAGDDRYKRSLATHGGRLFWLTLQKRRLSFSLERGLRAAKRLLWRQPKQHPEGNGAACPGQTDNLNGSACT